MNGDHMNYSKPNPVLYNLPFQVDDFNDMPYRPLGTSGFRVPNIGLGTWKIGYPETGDGSRVDEKQAFQIFDKAVELGVTLWDTANRYNNSSGNSERVIGNWLKNNSSERRNIILATKIFGAMDGLTPNHCGLSRASILDAVYASLERLQVNYIDLLYFHAFDPLRPIEESLSAIEDLARQDLIRYFAVSNFTVDQLGAYHRVIRESGSVRSRILAVQNQYDLLQGENSSYTGVLEHAAQTGISYIAWSPLARGLLTERYLDPDAAGPGDRLFDEGTVEEKTSGANLEKLHQLRKLSREWGLELPQLVIAYMLTLPGMGPVIPSSSSVQQLVSNAAAGKVVLNEEQQRKIKGLLQ
ncbi:K+ channel subunit beta [Flammeovirgaceae bacterium 311]|nr:K+ channel subunit beta [Flammeovirgaceae bacterium 311]